MLIFGCSYAIPKIIMLKTWAGLHKIIVFLITLLLLGNRDLPKCIKLMLKLKPLLKIENKVHKSAYACLNLPRHLASTLALSLALLFSKSPYILYLE